MSVYGERIVVIEERVKQLDERMERLESKIDDLLALRNKGAGVFWLASVLLGTSVLGVLTMFISWLKH